MPRSSRDMRYVNLYLEAETVEAVDKYAESMGMSRSQAVNGILASTVRDDVPMTQVLVDAWKSLRAKQRAEKATGSVAVSG